jgi:cellulose synthase/poly-beta-1,6-N-acetylglucosamine synthase-like glycosyltransferase
MPSPALSVLVPARDEHYYDIDLLGQTVRNVLANTSELTEIVCVLDGYSSHWPTTPLPVDPRLTVIHHRTAIGQRAATNEAAHVARGEYVMKLDAHCAIDKDFDTKLLARFEPDWTVVPRQYNLHVFDWKCKQCGHLKYQCPKPPKCEK